MIQTATDAAELARAKALRGAKTELNLALTRLDGAAGKLRAAGRNREAASAERLSREGAELLRRLAG
jgi:hypothetical protein